MYASTIIENETRKMRFESLCTGSSHPPLLRCRVGMWRNVEHPTFPTP